LREARFPDPGLTSDQHDSAITALCLVPAPDQQRDLLLAADQRRLAVLHCFEAALDRARPQHLPSLHRPLDAFNLVAANIATFEQVAEQPSRRRAYRCCLAPLRCLQAGGES
jgi:hypothetical protein